MRERENARENERGREVDSQIVSVCVWGGERVCLRERARESERERNRDRGK